MSMPVLLAGSPKIASSAGLPSQVAPDELTKSFDLHSQQAGLGEEQCATLREMDAGGS